MYKLVVFIPINAADRVKKALFDAGHSHTRPPQRRVFRDTRIWAIQAHPHAHPHRENVDQLTG